MDDTGAFSLESTCLRLRSDATIEKLPVDETLWPRIVRGELGSFHHEFLVTLGAMDGDWRSWEMHPHGDEIVCLLSGAVEFVLELDGAQRSVLLREPGSYVFVPRGTWHTAHTSDRAQLLFISGAEGTRHRPLEGPGA